MKPKESGFFKRQASIKLYVLINVCNSKTDVFLSFAGLPPRLSMLLITQFMSPPRMILSFTYFFRWEFEISLRNWT